MKGNGFVLISAIAWEANTCCRSRLVPQGSTSVQYSYQDYMVYSVSSASFHESVYSMRMCTDASDESFITATKCNRLKKKLIVWYSRKSVGRVKKRHDLEHELFTIVKSFKPCGMQFYGLCQAGSQSQ